MQKRLDPYITQCKKNQLKMDQRRKKRIKDLNICTKTIKLLERKKEKKREGKKEKKREGGRKGGRKERRKEGRERERTKEREEERKKEKREKVEPSRSLWGSWAQKPFCVPCSLFVGNRLQTP